MKNINFDDLAKVIKSIPNNTHYWLVRTMGETIMKNILKMVILL